MKKKLKKPSKLEIVNLLHKIENEGLEYYMLHYGPDLELLKRLRFKLKNIEQAIATFAEVETKLDMLREEYLYDEE